MWVEIAQYLGYRELNKAVHVYIVDILVGDYAKHIVEFPVKVVGSLRREMAAYEYTHYKRCRQRQGNPSVTLLVTRICHISILYLYFFVSPILCAHQVDTIDACTLEQIDAFGQAV